MVPTAQTSWAEIATTPLRESLSSGPELGGALDNTPRHSIPMLDQRVVDAPVADNRGVGPHGPDIVSRDLGYPGKGIGIRPSLGAFDNPPLLAIPVLDQGLGGLSGDVEGSPNGPDIASRDLGHALELIGTGPRVWVGSGNNPPLHTIPVLDQWLFNTAADRVSHGPDIVGRDSRHSAQGLEWRSSRSPCYSSFQEQRSKHGNDDAQKRGCFEKAFHDLPSFPQDVWLTKVALGFVSPIHAKARAHVVLLKERCSALSKPHQRSGSPCDVYDGKTSSEVKFGGRMLERVKKSW
jgi:hypothetical protein